MKRFLWIGVCLILLTVVWAGAQDKRGLKSIPPIEPVPEKEKPIEKPQLRSMEGIPAVPETAKQLEKRPLSPMEKVSALIEKRNELKKQVLSPSEQIPLISEGGIKFEGKLRLKDSSPVPVSQEVLPQYSPTTLKQLPDVTILEEPPIQYVPSGLREMSPIQPVDGMVYQVQEFSDFRGGLNLSAPKTQLAPNEALELENALWTETGELVKREGYSEHSTFPDGSPNFLYRYYQEDGDAYWMGGSDTALYYYNEDSSDWLYLVGTEGTSGRWDGTTFEDLFVATHEGITPIVWDGSTFVEMGVIADSFKIRPGVWGSDYSEACSTCSVGIYVTPNPGWVTNEWAGYIIGSMFWSGAAQFWGYGIVTSNTDYAIFIRRTITHTAVSGTYLYLYSWFNWTQILSGDIDSVSYTGSPCVVDLWDFDTLFADTGSYRYVFEVTAGKGVGKVLYAHTAGTTGAKTEFSISGYGEGCFDTTTEYAFYAPSFYEGSKFVENFDSRLWLGWTGTGEEQAKNRIVYSDLNDLGNWPSGNNIYFESGDGDFITGMIPFYSDQGGFRSAPLHELIVTQNNALYKIFPSGTDYDNAYIASGVGCCSNAGLASIEGRFLVFPDQHGVFAYDGNKVLEKPLSAKIAPIFQGWNLLELEDVSAVYNPKDRHYYISYPDMISGVGDYIATWDDNRGSVRNIYARKYTAFGAQDDTSFKVNDETWAIETVNRGFPEVRMDDKSYFVIVWADWRSDTANIYAQRYDSSCSPIGTNFMVNDDSTKDQTFPDIAMNGAGSFVIAWEDERLTGGVNDDIFAQRYDSSGSPIDTNFLVNDDGAVKDQGLACVAISESGKFVIAFKDDRNNEYDIYGQLYDSAGSAIGSNFKVNELELTALGFPEVAMDEAGNFVIVWTHHSNGTSEDIYAQRYDSSGTKIGSNFMVNSSIEGVWDGNSDIAMDYDGNFIVIWQTGILGEHIYGQRYNSSADTLGSNFRVNDDTVYADAKSPGITMDNLGNFVIAWEDHRYPGGSNVYAQRYNSDGVAVGSNFRVNEDTVSTKERPDIALNYANPFFTITNSKTLTWNVDHGGWSRQSLQSSAYCYQHSISDTIKVLFANPEEAYVYYYGTQADDLTDPVILTYQTGYFGFSQHPSFETEMRYATVEAFLDTGNIYLTWYKNYSDSVYYDSLICGVDCRQEMILPADSLWGKNISMKLKTGSAIDDFTLSRFWWEYTIEQNRK